MDLSLMWANYAATVHQIGAFELGSAGGCLSPRPNDFYVSTKTIPQPNQGHEDSTQNCNLQQSHATDSLREDLIGERDILKSIAKLTSAHPHQGSSRTQ